MRKVIIASTLLAIAAVSGCSKDTSVAAVDPAQISDSIKAKVAEIVMSFNNHDAAGAVSHDEPGYIGMFHGTPNSIGVAADLAVTKIQVSDPAAKVTLGDQVIDVAAAGDMAIDRATYDYAYTDPQTHQTKLESGNWVMCFKKQADGTWKLAWSVLSDTGPTSATVPAPA